MDVQLKFFSFSLSYQFFKSSFYMYKHKTLDNPKFLFFERCTYYYFEFDYHK